MALCERREGDGFRHSSSFIKVHIHSLDSSLLSSLVVKKTHAHTRDVVVVVCCERRRCRLRRRREYI